MTTPRDEHEATTRQSDHLSGRPNDVPTPVGRRVFLGGAASALGLTLLGSCSARSDEGTAGGASSAPTVVGATSTTVRAPSSGPIWSMGAAELADRIRARELSTQEVVESVLGRIDAVNGQVNAITVVLASSARAAAIEADKQIARGAKVGPLHGVPFTVKENIEMEGSATTQGLVAFKDAIPSKDQPHIAQLKAAGAIPIARTNVPDIATRWHTDNELRGATINPWDASRTPGGSSGGDAVALATGMTPLGMGNDYFGSLRVPAQFCGVASLRPTLGRVPQASTVLVNFPMSLQLMAVQGPMARHVADLRLAFQSMCGFDARDPWWTAAPFEGEKRPRRVAVQTLGADPQVAAGVRKAADALADAGYDVIEDPAPMILEGSNAAQDLVASDSKSLADQVRPFLGRDATSFIDTWVGLRPPVDKAGYVGAFSTRQGVARAWTQFQETRPLVLGPVSTKPPFVVGRDLEGTDAVSDIFDSLRLTVVVNLTGLPAVTVPVGEADGLPQAVQIIGPRYREDLVLTAAEAIESKVGLITPIEPR